MGEEELEELEEEKTKCGKCRGRYLCAGTFSTRWHIFYALARFRVKEQVSLSSVYCALSPRWFYSPSFHSVER